MMSVEHVEAIKGEREREEEQGGNERESVFTRILYVFEFLMETLQFIFFLFAPYRSRSALASMESKISSELGQARDKEDSN